MRVIFTPVYPVSNPTGSDGATLKRELGACWDSIDQARLAVFSWIAFYNHRRRHSALDYHSTVDYETITTQQQPEAA